MAGASLLTLLDDIAAILDDVALMSKVAARKTAGVLGDDLALNAQQVSGVSADRELPVVWAVALGSLKNKCILVPAALLISAFIPQAITPLLMFGGLFLCYEGFEKLYHSYSHKKAKQGEEHDAVPVIEDLAAYEKDKIKNQIDRKLSFANFAEVVFISAINKMGFSEMMRAIKKAYQSSQKKLSTPQINSVLENALIAHPPKIIKGIRPKLKYAHQGGLNPPQIIIHGLSLIHI